MRLVVVVDEFGDGIVVTAGYHAGGGGFRFNCRKGLLAVFFLKRKSDEVHHTYTSSHRVVSPRY